MKLSNPIENLAASLHDAAYAALPDYSHLTRDWAADRHLSMEQRVAARKAGQPFPTKTVTRRPAPDECSVVAMFGQTWGSTALGFGGIGGAAMTEAYTVVIQGPARQQAVYWAGRFAYLIEPEQQTPEQATAWASDLAMRQTHSRRDAVARYGARWPSKSTAE